MGDFNGFGDVELLPVALADTNGWSHFVSHLGSNGSLGDVGGSELVAGWGRGSGWCGRTNWWRDRSTW